MYAGIGCTSIPTFEIDSFLWNVTIPPWIVAKGAGKGGEEEDSSMAKQRRYREKTSELISVCPRRWHPLSPSFCACVGGAACCDSLSLTVSLSHTHIKQALEAILPGGRSSRVGGGRDGV